MKKALITIGLLTSLGAMAQNGGIAINNTGATPNNNAMLDIQSDSKGVLIPRLTTVARNTLGTALTLPDNGMMVYDKNMNLFFYWDGTQWVQVGSGSGDNWGTQVVQTAGTNISGDGTTGNPLTITDGDSDPTNEIELPTGGANGQVLSTDGSGNYTWINDNAGTDNQNIQNLAFDPSTNILTVGIQNGTSQTVDLTVLLNDADSDPNNEIQDLSLNTTTNILTITNNGTPTNIDLTPYLDNTDNQNLSNSTAGSNVTVNISRGTGTTFSINDADADPTNEIELPTGGTNGQVLSTNGSGTYTWVTDNAGTDNQDLSLTGNTLSLTNDGTPVDLSGYLDNTDNQNISGSGLSGTILTIGIQNGTNETIDLSSLTDADWYKVGTTSPPTNINDDIFTQGNVGIGVLTPTAKLQIGDGSSAVGSAYFSRSTSSPNLGIYESYDGVNDINIQTGIFGYGVRPNDDAWQIWEKGSHSTWTQLFTVLNNGNIGINTAIPTEKLEVQGSVKIVDGTQGLGKVLTSDVNGRATWETPLSSWFGVLDNGSVPAQTTFSNYLVNFTSGYKIPVTSGGVVNTTNNSITVPKTGVYRISISGWSMGNSSPYLRYFEIRKNGISIANPHFGNPSSGWGNYASFTLLANLNANDVITLDMIYNSASLNNRCSVMQLVVELIK